MGNVNINKDQPNDEKKWQNDPEYAEFIKYKAAMADQAKKDKDKNLKSVAENMCGCMGQYISTMKDIQKMRETMDGMYNSFSGTGYGSIDRHINRLNRSYGKMFKRMDKAMKSVMEARSMYAIESCVKGASTDMGFDVTQIPFVSKALNPIRKMFSKRISKDSTSDDMIKSYEEFRKAMEHYGFNNVNMGGSSMQAAEKLIEKQNEFMERQTEAMMKQSEKNTEMMTNMMNTLNTFMANFHAQQVVPQAQPVQQAPIVIPVPMMPSYQPSDQLSGLSGLGGLGGVTPEEASKLQAVLGLIRSGKTDEAVIKQPIPESEAGTNVETPSSAVAVADQNKNGATPPNEQGEQVVNNEVNKSEIEEVKIEEVKIEAKTPIVEDNTEVPDIVDEDNKTKILNDLANNLGSIGSSFDDEIPESKTETEVVNNEQPNDASHANEQLNDNISEPEALFENYAQLLAAHESIGQYMLECYSNSDMLNAYQSKYDSLDAYFKDIGFNHSDIAKGIGDFIALTGKEGIIETQSIDKLRDLGFTDDMAHDGFQNYKDRAEITYGG